MSYFKKPSVANHIKKKESTTHGGCIIYVIKVVNKSHLEKAALV